MNTLYSVEDLIDAIKAVAERRRQVLTFGKAFDEAIDLPSIRKLRARLSKKKYRMRRVIGPSKKETDDVGAKLQSLPLIRDGVEIGIATPICENCHWVTDDSFLRELEGEEPLPKFQRDWGCKPKHSRKWGRRTCERFEWPEGIGPDKIDLTRSLGGRDGNERR